MRNGPVTNEKKQGFDIWNLGRENQKS
jgi:hypothetical protein